jgi:hypothetical protein
MNSNYATTLDGRNENTVYVTRSYMYEFIILFVISVIVLTITIRNLTSDTVTAGGYTICCIILILFVISVVMYVGNLVGSHPFSSANSANSANRAIGPIGSGSNEGPVIRIRYV